MSMDSHRTGFGRARLSAGTRLNGIYEIDRPIGMGGMGEIYYGHVIETGDPVAIKVLLPEFADNAAALTLFRKEASALHYVHHDAVVRYFVFSVEPVLERPYLAMEYVPGRTLRSLLRERGPFSADAALNYRHGFATKGHTLTSELRFEEHFEGGPTDILDHALWPVGAPATTTLQQTRTVWTHSSTTSLKLDYVHPLGGGLRYKLPIGPIRLDVGYGLRQVRNDDRIQVYLTVGQAF